MIPENGWAPNPTFCFKSRVWNSALRFKCSLGIDGGGGTEVLPGLLGTVVLFAQGSGKTLLSGLFCSSSWLVTLSLGQGCGSKSDPCVGGFVSWEVSL